MLLQKCSLFPFSKTLLSDILYPKGCLHALLERCQCADPDQVLEITQRLMPLMQLVQQNQQHLGLATGISAVSEEV